MRAVFTITVDVDPDEVAREGKRSGLPLDRALEAVWSDVENRLCDSIKYRDGVQRVGSNVKLPQFRQVEAGCH